MRLNYTLLLTDISKKQGLGLLPTEMPLIINTDLTTYTMAYITYEDDEYLTIVVPDTDGAEFAKILNKNGKALKNKKITFKINGKKYKAKTNKKGIAKIKIKNLKAGKYKIITTYAKQKNTNTITVKK